MKYIFQKVISVTITLVMVSLLTFLAFSVLGGDPIQIILGVDADPLQVEAMRKQLGLDNPLHIQYLNWITGLFKGDLGISYRYQIPVTELIANRIPTTVSIAVVSFSLTLCIVIPVGIFLALNHDKKSTVLFSGISQLGVSLPTFWLGIILILVFAVTFKVLPPGDFAPIQEGFFEWLKYLILPCSAIAIGTSAVVIRYLKNSLLDQSMMDYVRTAKSKGLTKNKIMHKHILKNALLPVITILGMVVVDVLGGSVLIENVFNMPGIGSLIVSSVSARDLPVIQSLVFYLSVIVVISNLVVDIIYRFVDPRIRVK